MKGIMSNRDKLKNLYENFPRSFAQKLKSKVNKDLYEWFINETRYITASDSLRGIAYIYLYNPDLSCPYGNTKSYKQGKIRFCGSPDKCECHKNEISSKNLSVWENNDKNEIIEKRRQTCLEKYGVKNVLLTDENKQKRLDAIDNRNSDDYIKIKTEFGYHQVVERLKNVVTPLFNIKEYKGSSRKNVYLWQCVKCNHEFSNHIDYGTIPRCPVCYPYTVSNFESEIAEFIKSIESVVITNTKAFIPPKELDIVIPKKRIAIECNGIYWHSTKKRADKFYHVDKFLDCQKNNIHLIQIFEDEWYNKQPIIKNRLLSILGHSNRIFARNTIIKEVDHKSAKSFCEQHHLHGWAIASKYYGLYHNTNLVAVMTFGKPRYTSEYDWELIRFCSKDTVVGGASKIFKYFLVSERPKSVVSYADRFWSNGNLYNALGFVDETKDIRNVGYYYMNRYDRISRHSLTRKKLTEQGFDINMPVDEITDQLGYLKIYTAGNFKFVYKNLDPK